jgi:hypothetical protein
MATANDPPAFRRHAGEGRHPRLSFNISDYDGESTPVPLGIRSSFYQLEMDDFGCLVGQIHALDPQLLSERIAGKE